MKRKQPPVEEVVSSDSDDSDIAESDKCIMCKLFYPPCTDTKLSFINIVKWGCCDLCQGWVHLTFCTQIKVLRRGDSFLCPKCTSED
ncbi:hypothetical protein DPMN_081674 [Dreissena polymorpha]|uniref:Uncharacterized protein n=1 Tax=Dreissena polymorpha TaxID=45954 RepID=A0A9D3Y9G2_DREPO|nr:hypothetical protein DPMN_081674 [Dreissena polymorpha]